jgi:GTP-binding protein EngB required for normal cell division
MTEKSAMSARYNLAVVGQTGVGKSSLINYLYPDAKARVGVGRPVTSSGFHAYEFEINRLPTTLFDSWGLEVGKHEQWISHLEHELKGRGIDQPAKNWFHSVFYCINAAGARVQDCDTQIIKQFLKAHYKVSVVLTKCDLVSEKDERELRATLQGCVPVNVISLCSVETKTRAGDSKRFGVDQVERRAFLDFFESLIDRLPGRCRYVLEQELRQLPRDARKMVGVVGINESDARKTVDEQYQRLYEQLHTIAREEVESVVKLYGTFLQGLQYPRTGAIAVPDLKHFNSTKLDAEFSWWQWPLIALAIPAVLVFGAVAGRSSAAQGLAEVIDSYEKILNEEIDLLIGEIEASLRTYRDRAETAISEVVWEPRPVNVSNERATDADAPEPVGVIITVSERAFGLGG